MPPLTEPLESQPLTLLHVGCGQNRKNRTTPGFNTPDWRELRLDIDASVEPDVIGTMTDMSSVATESVNAIFSSHNIEHLYPHEVGVALKEFLRVLVPDGFAVITCPDLQSVCALVAQDKLTEAAYQSLAGPIAPLDILYGHRPHLSRGNLYMAHRCGFTQKLLVGTLRSSGFATVASLARGRSPHFDLWALASKSTRSDTEMRAMARAHFPT
jgi:predicted SAM-dependent methyltransferase